MSNCTQVQYIPEQIFNLDQPNLRGECSGQGVCIPQFGICACNEGWTGASDFFGNPGTDCQIFILGIQIEYGILLALTLLSWYKQAPGLRKRYQDYITARSKAAAKGKTYKFYQNRAAATMVLWNLVGAPCMIITCILRMAVPEERIGVTFALTFFFMMTKNAFYVCVFLYQPYLFKTLLKGEQMSDSAAGQKIIRFVDVTAAIGCALSVAGSFVPFLSVGSPSLATASYITYYILSTVGLYYNASIAIAIFFKAEKLFGASYAATQDEKILATKKKMKGFQKQIFTSALVFGTLYLIFFIWPFWWNLHDYFHAVTWIVFIKVANDIALGTLEKKTSEKSAKKELSSVVATGMPTGMSDSEPEGKSISMSV